MTTPLSTAADEVLGARLLREIAVDQGSLESLLRDLRAAHTPRPPRTGIAELDALWGIHGGRLAITGRGIQLVYHIINELVGVRGGTVAVVDVEGRFSPSHLDCELRHVHVFRPTASNLKATLDSVEGYMLWGDHGSKEREWMGTIVNGGIGGDITTGWRGWLTVEREAAERFGLGISAEEALIENRGQEAIASRGWRAVSQQGSFSWR